MTGHHAIESWRSIRATAVLSAWRVLAVGAAIFVSLAWIDDVRGQGTPLRQAGRSSAATGLASASADPAGDRSPAFAEEPPLPTERRTPAASAERREGGLRRADTNAAPSPAADAARASSALTLDQAISECLANDPRIRVGMEIVQQAKGDAWTASLAPNPEMNVAGGLLPLSRRFTPEAPAGPSEFDVGVSYPLDWFLFGKRAAAMASAALGVRASEHEYADVVRKRVAETALAFFDVLEAKDLLALVREDTSDLERVEGVVRRAVANGGKPQVELNRLRLELLTRRRELRQAESTLVTGKAKLRALLGRSDAETAFDVAGTLDGPLTAEPLDAEESFSLAEENRPDLLALRRKVARAQAEVVVERRNALPELTSDLGIAHQFQRPIGAPDATMWGTGLTMTVPLFNRNQGNRAKAASVVAQSNHELRAGLVDLRAEIEEAVQTFRTARQNAASLAEEELRLAVQVRDNIRKAYEAGGRPLLDVLDAQRNFRETYRNYITSRAEYWRALHKYNSAIGKQVTP